MLSKLSALILAFVFCSMANALSLSIPKTLIDKAVSAKFPKEKLTIKLDQPSTKFDKERQKIALCGTWNSKLPQKGGEFCLDFQPQWNKAKGDIQIAKVNILKLTEGENKAIPSALTATLNTTLLTLLDGTSVYHMPDMIGKHVDSIEVNDSSFKLQF
jgi:hypothetical protein